MAKRNKLIGLVLISQFLCGAILSAQTVEKVKEEADNQFDGIIGEKVKPVNTLFAKQLRKGVGFAAASGHVEPGDIKPLLGKSDPAASIPGPSWLKVGVGLNMAFTSLETKAMTDAMGDILGDEVDTGDIEGAAEVLSNFFPIGLVPIFKIKLALIPSLPLDIGLRFGTVPTFSESYEIDDNSTVDINFGWTLGGVQVRMNQWTFGPLYLTYGANVDIYAGSYGLGINNNYTRTEAVEGVNVNYEYDLKTKMDNSWFAFAVSPFFMASANLVVIKPFAGLGLNMNFGQAVSQTKVTGSVSAKNDAGTELTSVDYEPDPIRAEGPLQLGNVRLIYGIHLFYFMSLSGESDILFKSNSFTWNIIDLHF